MRELTIYHMASEGSLRLEKSGRVFAVDSSRRQTLANTKILSENTLVVTLDDALTPAKKAL